MYDIYQNILPFAADGPKDIQGSIEMCKFAAGQGVKAIVAAPRFIEGESEIDIGTMYNQISILNRILIEEGIDITVLPGMEVFVNPDLVDLYENNKIIALNNKNYMLIKFSDFESLPPYIYEVIFKLELKGIRPLLSNIERCRMVIDRPNIVHKLIERGCCIVVNAGSIEGLFGKAVKKTADLLISHNMVHAISTFKPSRNGKMVSIRTCHRLVSEKYGKKTADDLIIKDLKNIVECNDEIDIGEPVKVERKRFWII